MIMTYLVDYLSCDDGLIEEERLLTDDIGHTRSYLEEDGCLIAHVEIYSMIPSCEHDFDRQCIPCLLDERRLAEYECECPVSEL